MMTDMDCREEEHEAICRRRDIEQGCYQGENYEEESEEEEEE